MTTNRTGSKALLGAAGAALLAWQAQAATVNVGADITADTTWTSNNVYVLQQPIFVRDGAILTIQAGTLIRGEKEFTTDPGALIITRGSKIRAMGTAQAPIIMTDMNDSLVPGMTPQPPYDTLNNGITRKWGGLLLLGRTYLATNVGGGGAPSPNASLELQIEGLEPFGAFSKYGGGDDDDDSGEIHYVTIRYGGFVLGDANEINGLTLGGVGRGTDIDHVEVFQNKDDGYEWFGGTVNTKYLVSWCNADDSFDWDEGFRGKGQFWLAVQGPLSSEGDVSDKAAEMDGGMGDSSQPSSCPTIYNVTFVGTGKASGNKKNTALHFRDGTGGRYYNSAFLDFGGACALIEGATTNSSYDSADNTAADYVASAYYTHAAGGSKKLELKHCLFWNFGTNVAFGCNANTTGIAAEWGAEDNRTTRLDGDKAHLAYPLFTNAALSNQYASVLPITDLVRAIDPVLIGGRNYYPVEYIDPTLVSNSAFFATGMKAPADGFFSPVGFAGAFGSRNWANEWTTAYGLGLLYSGTGVIGNYDDFEVPQITQSYMTYSIWFPTTNGTTYNVEWTADLQAPWTLLTTVVGNGQTNTVTDTRPVSVSNRFYRVTTDYNP